MRELIEVWDGLSVVVRHDHESDAWFFIALHDATLGPPTGGCRMTVYPRPEDGLVDAMRLARGMTFKWAGVGMEFGGGKSVIALSRPLEGEERTRTLLRFGQLLEALRGAYWSGEDMGTTPEDMATIARETRYVQGVLGEGSAKEAVDPGPYTALGVLAGIRATMSHTLGSADLRDRSVLIQGAGDVGGPLASLLEEEGAHVLVSDLDEERARKVAARTGGEVVPPEQVYETPCDLFAPCAIGGILNRDTIPQLRCRMVAGAANNQLRDEEADSRRLVDREITYAPDYIVNAGGAIALILLGRRAPADQIHARIAGIESSVRDILDEAASTSEPPLVAAQRKVDSLLRKARSRKGVGSFPDR